METWKPIKNYEHSYEVSDLGKVRGLDRRVQSRYGKTRLVFGKTLKHRPDKDGYLSVNLKRNQSGETLRVHRLVCAAFHDNIGDKPQVNHINGVKYDNRAENLEWVTLSENRAHAYQTGLQNGKNRRGEKSNFNKLTENQVRQIRSMYKGDRRGLKKSREHPSFFEISKLFGVSAGCIQSIVKEKNWKWL